MRVSREQRAAMAADLFERVAKMIRGGVDDINPVRIVGGIALSLAIGGSERDESEYVRALGFAGVLDIEERHRAVAAILDGKHPPDSLVGRVDRMRKDATRYERQPAVTAGDWCDNGKVLCANAVLDLLGIDVSP